MAGGRGPVVPQIRNRHVRRRRRRIAQQDVGLMRQRPAHAALRQQPLRSGRDDAEAVVRFGPRRRIAHPVHRALRHDRHIRRQLASRTPPSPAPARRPRRRPSAAPFAATVLSTATVCPLSSRYVSVTFAGSSRRVAEQQERVEERTGRAFREEPRRGRVRRAHRGVTAREDDGVSPKYIARSATIGSVASTTMPSNT